jgi:membrane fusion protein (multidrug efflux system)
MSARYRTNPFFRPAAALLPFLALLPAGCKPSASQAPAGLPPPVVTVAAVEPRDIPVTREYAARTAGYREVEVRARVAGILERRNYREGALVKKGESLFTIDPEPFRVALARAEAELAVADARHAQAQREVARLGPVIEARAVSRKEYDDAVSAERIAAAEVKSARARVNEARLNLEYTRVEAPITGIASRAVVSEGTLVSGPAVLLTTVTQTDPMYVIFGIPDREYLAWRRDLDAGRLKLPADGKFRASIRLSDGSVYPYTGTVDFTDVRVDAQTGTSEARAQFSNPAGLLRAGEFVRIALQGAVRPAALVVPQRAVLEGPQGKFVYVLDAQNRAEPRAVEVGEWAGEGWIVNSGLKPGERVIVDGVLKVAPGVAVKVAGGAPQGSATTPSTAADSSAGPE